MSLNRKAGGMIGYCQENSLRKRPPGQGRIAKVGWYSNRKTRTKIKGK